MRRVQKVVTDLQGRQDDETTPLGTALTELLGGERGSLADLADRFTDAGLGHVMASWLGDDPDLPVSSRDLRHILGETRAQDLATLSGLQTGDFLIRLARLLPAAVRRAAREGGTAG